MCLDRVAGAGRRSHRPAEEDVVREDEVRREVFAERRGVQVDVAVTLLPREVRQATCLETLVAVENEDRQEAADPTDQPLSPGARECRRANAPPL